MTTETIKYLMKLKGVKSAQLAAHLGVKPQSLNNKFSRDSWTVQDLVVILDFLGCQLVIETKPDLRIPISPTKNKS